MADALGLVDKPMPIGASHSSAKQHQAFARCSSLRISDLRCIVSRASTATMSLEGSRAVRRAGHRTGGYDHERQILGYISHEHGLVRKTTGASAILSPSRCPLCIRMTRCVWCPRTASIDQDPTRRAPRRRYLYILGVRIRVLVRQLGPSKCWSAASKDLCRTPIKIFARRARACASSALVSGAWRVRLVKMTRSLKDSVALQTLLPRYDHGSGSLKMRFYDDRVRVASSKTWFSTSSDSDSDRGCVLQFGKVKDKTYCVDFSFPRAGASVCGGFIAVQMAGQEAQVKMQGLSLNCFIKILFIHSFFLSFWRI